MSSTITIDTEYYMTATATVDLSPKTWADVDEWYVKWDKLQVKFKGSDDWEVFDLESDTEEGVDWRQPNNAEIRDQDGSTIDEREFF